MKPSFRLAFSLFSLALSSSAAMALDQVTANSDMLNLVNQYYDAERAGAFPFVFLASVFVVVLGGLMVAKGDRFSKGMGWSLIVLSAGVGAGTIIYSSRITPKKETYVELLRTDPLAYRERQLAALEQTRQNFSRIILTDLSLVAASAGLAAYARSRRKNTVAGVGAGVLISFLSLTAVELHNRSRAIGYEESVRGFHPEAGAIGRDTPPL